MFDGRKCNSNQKCNNNKCWCECKNPKESHLWGKDYIWDSTTCTCENGKYLGNISSNSVITCDENIEVTKTFLTKTIPTKLLHEKVFQQVLMKKKVTCEIGNFYSFLAL